MSEYGLAPRSSVPDEYVAAVAAAVILSAPTASEVTVDRTPPWRFSGRWFNNGPYTASRRPRVMPN